MDEWFKTECGVVDPYDINYKLAFYNEMKGIPDFTRYPKRLEDVLPNTETHAKSERIVSGKYRTLKNPHLAVAFGKLQGRDNLYQKMNGLPLKTKEQMLEE